MKVLVGCEFSGTVREAFRRKGHEAWSCDLLDTQIAGNHIKGSVLDQLNEGWDLGIFHPPCTHLAISGSKYFEQKRRTGQQQEAIEFFMKLANAPIKKIAIENPIGIMSTVWRKPDQIIQPFQFGHPESKRTCLWLKNLPVLKPTNTLQLPPCGYWNNQSNDNQNRVIVHGKVIGWNNPLIARYRSVTYQGIADAMAEQWGNNSSI